MARFVFVQSIWTEYFGIMSLAASLKKAGHQATVVMDGLSRRRLVQAVLQERPAAVCFSCLTPNYGWCLDVARGIKESSPDLPVLFGGIHATLCPEIVLDPSIDAVCVGESDEAIVEMAHALEEGMGLENIKNLCLCREGEMLRNDIRPLIPDLDVLPFPDRTVYTRSRYFQKYRIIQIMTGRGCPYRCSFCHNHVQKRMYRGKGPYMRQRSVESVIAEIRETRTQFPTRNIVAFYDEVLWMDYEWLFSFLERYAREIRLPFGCMMTPKRVTEEVVKALKESGLVITGLAFETGDEKTRKELLRKPVSNEEYRHAAALLHAYHIPFTTNTVFGLPGETFEKALSSLSLNWEMKPTFPWAALFQPYPGTDLTTLSREQGYIAPDASSEVGESFYKKSLLALPDRDRIVNLQRLYIIAVRFPRLFPWVKWLTRLPPNPVFDFVFGASYAHYLHAVQKLSWREVVAHALRFVWSGMRFKMAERRNRRVARPARTTRKSTGGMQ